ncbi:unnamed protein product [Arabidopsis halleri]
MISLLLNCSAVSNNPIYMMFQNMSEKHMRECTLACS